MPRTRSWALLAASLLVLAAWSTLSAARAATQPLIGWFHIIQATAPDGTHPRSPVYALVDERGGWTRLLIAEPTARRLGDLSRLERQRVSVTVTRFLEQRGVRVAQVADIEPSGGRDLIQASVTTSPGRAGERSGAHAFLTVLCRFADSTSVTPQPRSYYERLMGTAAPGMDHYWREVSQDRIRIGNGRVLGWYDLPQPMEYYFPDGREEAPDFGRMVRDCITRIDVDVDWQALYGFNLQFNASMRYSWGGSWTTSPDGIFKSYAVTWMASWANQRVYAHELGHTFGLPHSSGPYSAVYDSRWDVMSGGSYLDGTDRIGVHTIAAHKDVLGWIPAARKYLPEPGSSREIVLERSARPSAEGYLMAQIPFANDPQRFYTVESRRRTGYDMGIPAEAVVLHTVTPISNLSSSGARVVDVDQNGDPNDAGASWTPGTTFTDSVNGVGVSVLAATSTGFRVAIRRGWRLGVEVTGSGMVAATAGGVSCTGSCERVYADRGTAVTLAASPAEGWDFAGWSGACGGLGLCSLLLTQDRTVSAVFVQPLMILADSLRLPAVMGAVYADTLNARGGSGARRWSLVDGALPRGITLDSVSGVLGGVPEEAGTFVFGAAVSAGSVTLSRAFELVVSKPAIQPPAVLDQLLGSGSLSADQLRFLDLLGNRNGRFDVGDVRAWLVDNRHLTGAAARSLRQLVEQRPDPEAEGSTGARHRSGEEP